MLAELLMVGAGVKAADNEKPNGGRSVEERASW